MKKLDLAPTCTFAEVFWLISEKKIWMITARCTLGMRTWNLSNFFKDAIHFRYQENGLKSITTYYEIFRFTTWFQGQCWHDYNYLPYFLAIRAVLSYRFCIVMFYYKDDIFFLEDFVNNDNDDIFLKMQRCNKYR